MSGLSDGAKIAGAGVSLALVFALALSSCESDVDLQRKPGLVDHMVGDAVATCVLQNDPLDQKPYEERLRDVLTETRASTLDYLIKNDITVCLDKRLQDQHNGFWTDDAEGIYYPDVKVISLWDNGKDAEQAGFWGTSAVGHGPTFLDHFEGSFESLSEVTGPLFAHHYTSRVGKSTISHYEWHSASQRSMGGVMEHQPYLREAPVIAQP